MAEHSELVCEIALVEKMSTVERLKHAKKRRTQQLKRFSQYEKQLGKDSKRKTKQQSSRRTPSAKRPKTNRVIFASNIVLLEAATRNDIAEVERLMTSGVSPDVTNEDGLTALHQCCIDDQEAMLNLLVKHRANVNARDSELWSPLHAAATCGHVHLCKTLIEHGAELLAVNADGNMPYDICEDDVTLDFIENEMAKRGVTQEKIDDTRLSTEKTMLDDLQALAAKGEDLEFRGRNGETPLHVAAANGYIQAAEFLLEHHVTVDATDNDSWQPIHAAACWGHLPILEMLVHSGADLDARTKNGESPLDICEDPELRHRIVEMRDEMESHRATRSHDLKRRRSANTRSSITSKEGGTVHYSSNTSLVDKAHSASIRRTSMREKAPMALKEAREEAQRMRESAASADDDDIEEEAEREERRNHANNKKPVSDLDDVAVHVNGAPAAQPPAPRGETLSPFMPDTSADTHHDTGFVNTTSFPDQTRQENAANQHKEKEASKRRDQKQAGLTKLKIPPGGGGGGGGQHPVEGQRGGAAPAGRPRTPSPTPTPPPTAASANQHSGGGTPPQPSPPTSVNSLSLAGLPTSPTGGTLAELKMKRAQREREQRNGDGGGGAPKGPHPTPHAPSAVPVPVPVNNGQTTEAPPSGSHLNIEQNGLKGNAYYVTAGEPPRKKFTASTTEIIGGTDSKKGCCIIL